MDDLGKLVNSLSKSEKRYFRLFSDMQGGEKTYLKLFDAIDKLGDCDDEKIKKMFAKEDFVKRLPAVKGYLSGQILKTLRVIYTGDTVEFQVKEMIDHVAILYEKRLFRHCAKILERARELASQHELTLHLIEINIWQEKISLETLDMNKFKEILTTSAEVEIDLLEVRKNITRYRNMYNQMVYINKTIKEARTEEEQKRFKQIINDPLFKSVENAVCFDSKHYYYMTHLIYLHAVGDYKKSLVVATDHLELLERYPAKLRDKPKMYISALHNILLCQIQLHDYDNFDEVLNKLRSFQVRSLNTEVNQFVSSYIFEMVKLLDTGEFQKSAEIRKAIIDGIERYKDKINPIEETSLVYNLFYSYFGTREYSKALSTMNKLINEYQKELREDIQSAVRILNLILHYELRNDTLLEHNAASTNRFLNKNNRLYKLETVILNFTRKKMLEIVTRNEEVQAFTELKKQFMELAEDPFEKKAFEYFDYISWADSKIENKTFEEIVQRKFIEKKKMAGNAASNHASA